MGWRVVIVDSPCKISVSGNYLILRADEIRKIHLPEVYYLMIACSAVNITGIALCELARQKIKVVFCDEKRNPYGELTCYYGCFNCAKKLRMQIEWDKETVSSVNTAIIAGKILNQAKLLRKYGFEERAEVLEEYVSEIELNDASNREGHAAKVYFNTLFGKNFSRSISNNINAALNYGYSIVLSEINRAVVACGRLTQLGINHKNEFNEFNFSCDLIEPWRVVVDEYVYNQGDRCFDKNYKFELVGLLNKRLTYGRDYTLHDAINVYVKNVLDCLDCASSEKLELYQFV